MISHATWCQQSAVMKAEAEKRLEVGTELRVLFPNIRPSVDPNAPVVEMESSSESADVESTEAMDIDEPQPRAAPLPVPKIKKKGKKKRFRLRLWQKVEILDSYPETLQSLTSKSPNRSFNRQDVIEVMSHASGVPFGTISKIFYHEEELRKKFEDKYKRRRFTFGSGRKARFPDTEVKVAEKVKERRRKNYAVFMSWVMTEYSKLAMVENKQLALRTNFGSDLFLLFLKRNRFARRKPSNLKPMSLTESQKAVRGWLRYLRSVLDGGVPVILGDSIEIDSKWGRFPLDCRLNKDEVPGYFGDPAMTTISHRGEGSTKVLIPEGWGDRICTLIVTLTPNALHKKVGIVFRGQGKRINKKEQEFYETLKNVEIFFQPKAWVDVNIELEVVRTILVPHAKAVKRDYESRGLKFPGILDVEDNFSAHLNEYVLRSSHSFNLSHSLVSRVSEAKVKAGILPMFLAAKTTDASQHVDNNNGKMIKKDVSGHFQTYLQDFDWESNPKGKIALRDRRMLMAKIVNTVVETFDEKHPHLVKNTARQCGMAMTIDGSDWSSLQPALYASSSFTASFKNLPSALGIHRASQSPLYRDTLCMIKSFPMCPWLTLPQSGTDSDSQILYSR